MAERIASGRRRGPNLRNLGQIGVFLGNLRQVCRQVGFGLFLNIFVSKRFSVFVQLTLNQRVTGSIPVSPIQECGLWGDAD